jgi:penicillin amidase
MLRRMLTIAGTVVALALLAISIYAAGIVYGFRSAAKVDGRQSGLPLHGPVQIVRDERFIPHIRAGDEHDLFFAQGYAVGSDRLFQIDLMRRLVYGRLAEIFGPPALTTDEESRTVDVAALAERQWEHIDTRERAALSAFADGVNAAREREPLPVEYRIALIAPQAWRPQDSLAVGFALSLDLIDPWNGVAARAHIARTNRFHEALFAMTDPKYDAPASRGAAAPLPPLPAHNVAFAFAASRDDPFSARGARGGSNDWAIGAARSTTGRALVANDPHLHSRMPGIWYVVDLSAPGYHVAGAAFPGTPGVILGHNDEIAWGVTNGTTCSESLYSDPATPVRTRREHFNVRFGTAVERDYERTRHGFVIRKEGGRALSVAWSLDTSPDSPLSAFDALDRARSARDVPAALARFAAPTQNVVFADRSGVAGYHLAGPVPNDPLWCLGVHSAADPAYPLLPAEALPHVDPARDALVFTANNRMYGGAYPHRLTAFFDPPYRAYRIRALLHSKDRFGVADFVAMQSDTFSPADLELARETLQAAERSGSRDPSISSAIGLLRSFDGRFDPASRSAALVSELRRNARAQFAAAVAGDRAADYVAAAAGSDMSLMMRVLRERPGGWIEDYDAFLLEALRKASAAPAIGETWSQVNELTPHHPFFSLGIATLDGLPLAGRGDSYAVRVQHRGDGHGQSFRAVWDVGNWDAGGISIPSGESGEPGSGHYTDLTASWNENIVSSLPYSAAAVERSARHRLTLAP